MTEIEKTALVLAKFKKKKPLLPVFIGEKTTGKGEEILKKKKVGNFEYPVDVKEILEKLAFKKKPLSAPSPMSEREGLLMEFERTKSLLQKYKISMIPSFLAKEKEDLKEIVSQINFPWAMKINSFQILHRTDYGGVKLDIRSLPEAEKAREEIIKNIRNKKPEAEIKGVIVQEMARGKEVIIGMKRDRTFGPVIAFGLGGIFVEVFKDVSLRIAPLLKKDVQEMIEEIKGFEVLKGQRGEEAVNFKALEKIILSLSSLSLENKEIKEIDLNPVIIDQNMAWVVDAKLVTYENRRESEVRPPQLRAHNL